MENEEIVKTLAEHSEKLKVANHRIYDLEKQQQQIPAQNWNSMTRTAFTTIISAIAGAAALAFINSIVPFL